MKKQEAIEEIENLEGLTIYDKIADFDSEMIPKKKVLNIVKQLDEPEKPPEPKPIISPELLKERDFWRDEAKRCYKEIEEYEMFFGQIEEALERKHGGN